MEVEAEASDVDLSPDDEPTEEDLAFIDDSEEGQDSAPTSPTVDHPVVKYEYGKGHTYDRRDRLKLARERGILEKQLAYEAKHTNKLEKRSALEKQLKREDEWKKKHGLSADKKGKAPSTSKRPSMPPYKKAQKSEVTPESMKKAIFPAADDWKEALEKTAFYNSWPGRPQCFCDTSARCFFSAKSMKIPFQPYFVCGNQGACTYFMMADTYKNRLESS